MIFLCTYMYTYNMYILFYVLCKTNTFSLDNVLEHFPGEHYEFSLEQVIFYSSVCFYV